VYIAARRVGAVVARARARAWLAARDVTPVTLMAGPLPADPWRRDVIVGLADRYEFLVVDLRSGEIGPGGSPILRGDDHPAVAVALATPGVRGFLTWQRYPSYTVVDEPAGVRVLMRDVRYAREGDRGFAVAEVRIGSRSGKGHDSR
jgi:inner membrane protein